MRRLARVLRPARATTRRASSSLASSSIASADDDVDDDVDVDKERVFVETYGCQMNANDSDVVRALLVEAKHAIASSASDATVVLVNTCAIRENAESRVWTRLRQLRAERRAPGSRLRAVGVLGCMAERLKGKILSAEEGLADMVVGPDAYRDVVRLLRVAREESDRRRQRETRANTLDDEDRMNVMLSLDETYADVFPLRADPMSPQAYVSVTRGCDNMCAFCVVPFTRGRERSRPFESVLEECRKLIDQGVKEITLLGQNVNSYADASEVGTSAKTDADAPFGAYAKGFTSVYKPKRVGARAFADLVEAVAAIDVECRVRFTSPHPKDFPDDLLRVIANTPNVCKQLHMPAQSGSTSTLERMRRGYTREAYLELIERAREIIPGVAISSDFISGFCGESEDEHAETLTLLETVRYEHAYMFHYSRRDKTYAARHFDDDVPEEVKKRRLAEVIETFRRCATDVNAREVGCTHLVLIEGASKKNPESQMSGRSDTGKRVVVQGKRTKANALDGDSEEVDIKSGDYVVAKIVEAGASTLVAEPVGVTTARAFYEAHGGASF